MTHDHVDLQQQLDFIARGRASRRYHTMEMLDYQRIDAHSFGVAMFTTIIVPVATPDRRALLLLAALTHDLGEHKTGDMPAPFKRSIPGLHKTMDAAEGALLDDAGLAVALDGKDKRVLTLADCADGFAHCVVERAKGNVFAREAAMNFWSYLTGAGKIYNPLGSDSDNSHCEAGEHALRNWLARNWTEANGGTW